jgi:hypothetical protein
VTMERHATALRSLALALVLLASWPAAARAVDLQDPGAQWLPRSDGAEWVYAWSNSSYSPAPRLERYQLTGRDGTFFRVSWQEVGLRADQSPAAGSADFRHTDAGLVNVNYSATPPPQQFPPLCASATQCGNSVVGSYFLTIWGSRSPALVEPLVKGARWTSVGGASSEVAGTNHYRGRERVVVPAFPGGVLAAKVQSVVTQTGAIGDPFGSGVRTVWWVYGVGPVRILFRHTGGETSLAELQSTTLAALPLPSDENLMPLNEGTRATFRWRNDRHMRRWSHQRFSVVRALNNSARVDVVDRRGPIDVRASYVFASRLSGVTNLTAVIRRASTRADFPRLGPRGGAEGRRRFVTPFDLMVYGFNPVLPAYPAPGQSWRSSRETRDWEVYGVTGVSRLIGRQRVRTPAGRFRATAVRTTLQQRGFRFGSGTRTSWFAPGVGLVRLVFRHADGSTSTVERIRR